MRISTTFAVQQNIDRISSIGAQVAATQEQLTTGRRINSPSDDPLGAASIIRLEAEINTRDTYLTNLDTLDASLSIEDSVLAQATEVLQRVRELTIQAGDGSISQTDREFIATEIRVRLDELQTLTNTRAPSGDFLFGGLAGDQPPFDDSLRFIGDGSVRQIEVDGGQRISVGDSARRIFADVPAAEPSFFVETDGADIQASRGLVVDQEAFAEVFPEDLVIRFNEPAEDERGRANYTIVRRSDQRPFAGFENVPYDGGATVVVAGLSVDIAGAVQAGDQVILETSNTQSTLLTLDRLATGLEQINAANQPQSFDSLIASALTNLDASLSTVSEVRAEVGARLNVVDSTRDLHQELTLRAQASVSSIRDVDFAEAVSQLATESFLLEAAQQTFIRVSQLSLFDRI